MPSQTAPSGTAGAFSQMKRNLFLVDALMFHTVWDDPGQVVDAASSISIDVAKKHLEKDNGVVTSV